MYIYLSQGFYKVPRFHLVHKYNSSGLPERFSTCFRLHAIQSFPCSHSGEVSFSFSHDPRIVKRLYLGKSVVQYFC
jgi:hypothetical protein